MSFSGVHRRLLFTGCLFWAICHGGAAIAAEPSGVQDATALLKQADDSKTLDQARFVHLLDELQSPSAGLSFEQQQYLHYLQAWWTAYRGDYKASDTLIETILKQSTDVTLRFRAGLFLVNTLVERSRYEEAFKRMSQLLAQLPTITDADARAQALTSAAYIYEEAGQYDLASSYADQFAQENQSISDYSCKAGYANLASLYKGGKLQGIEEQFQNGIDVCMRVGDTLYANGIRYYVASLYVQRGFPGKAIQLLRNNYDVLQRSGYVWLISQFDALLAKAYLDDNQLGEAKQSALAVVARGGQNLYAESLGTAYRILYLIEKRQGNATAALTYHERYMEANEGYLDSVSAKALAFQVVQQQLLAKKLEIDELSKRNQILQLQQVVGNKTAETSRLYIVLLITVVAFIAFWAYRIKRSQLRFMRLARRDGLTGIFNRQHFVNAAEQQLLFCKKSAREICLVLIDLDHFKVVNDTHGHSVGDRVLKLAVAACQGHLRSSDIFGRLGGEEFGIVLPDCPLDKALGRVELMRLAIASVAGNAEAPGVVVSASFGVASTNGSGYELRQLLIHADDALYQAKRDGRNRISVCDAARVRLRSV